VSSAFTSVNNWADGANITSMSPVMSISEYFEPTDASGQSSLSIAHVAHAYRNLRPRRCADNYGDSAVNKQRQRPEGADWQINKRGVAMITLSNGTRLHRLFVNNTSQNQVLTSPRITASAAITPGSSPHYESPGARIKRPTNQTVANSTLRASWSGSDFALLELIPFRSYNPFQRLDNVFARDKSWSAFTIHPATSRRSRSNNVPNGNWWVLSTPLAYLA
jgi:hypothetical protein